MVSTRSVKFKFTEGEKVLCYEPDPAKTKVLYNSKVLDITLRKDEQGKKVVHFLIHFQGWNSTWDRFVTEDYVLKDTEENRQLQKELARRAYLTARLGCCRGGNLYKRDRGRGGSRGRSGGTPNNKLGEQRGGGGTVEESSDEEPPLLPISASFKRLLEYDHQMITERNKVLNLPAEPNALTVLELFLKDYAVGQMRLVTGMHKNPKTRPASPPISLETFCRNLNVCREVVDGIRVYLDFMLEKTLLYPQERSQFTLSKSNALKRAPIKIKEENEEVPSKKFSPGTIQPLLKEEFDSEDGGSEAGDRRRSLRSHSATATLDSPNTSALQNGRASSRPPSVDVASSSCKIDSGTKTSTGVYYCDEALLKGMGPREQDLLNRIMSFSLMPESFKSSHPSLPCLVYGTMHLARLFVKLPEFLSRSTLTTAKNNMLVEYLTLFMKYLEEHPHWFGEEQYRDNIYEPVGELSSPE